MYFEQSTTRGHLQKRPTVCSTGISLPNAHTKLGYQNYKNLETNADGMDYVEMVTGHVGSVTTSAVKSLGMSAKYLDVSAKYLGHVSEILGYVGEIFWTRRLHFGHLGSIRLVASASVPLRPNSPLMHPNIPADVSKLPADASKVSH